MAMSVSNVDTRKRMDGPVGQKGIATWIVQTNNQVYLSNNARLRSWLGGDQILDSAQVLLN
jgi:hypothetical protein